MYVWIYFDLVSQFHLNHCRSAASYCWSCITNGNYSFSTLLFVSPVLLILLFTFLVLFSHSPFIINAFAGHELSLLASLIGKDNPSLTPVCFMSNGYALIANVIGISGSYTEYSYSLSAICSLIHTFMATIYL